MKPSHGLVSGEGIVPLIRFQDSAGPIARSVTDAAILLGVIDEMDTDYTASLDPKALEGVAVGVLRKAILDEETNAAFWLTRIDEGLARAGAKAKNLDETFADKPDLLPVIFLGLSCDTLPSGRGRNPRENRRRSTGLQRGRSSAPHAARTKHGRSRRPGPRSDPRGHGVTDDGMDQLYEEAALHVREGMAAILARTFAENEVDLLVSLATNIPSLRHGRLSRHHRAARTR